MGMSFWSRSVHTQIGSLKYFHMVDCFFLVDPRTRPWPRKCGWFDILRIPLSSGDICVSTVLLLTCFLWLWCSVWINTLDFLNQALFIVPRMTWSFLFKHSQCLIHCFTSCIGCVLCVCVWFVYTHVCIVSLVKSSKTQLSLFPTLFS